VNLIIDEAAPILKADLVRNEMIPDAREFALAFEVILHFPEQVKRDALDTRAYQEILRNINTKLIGKLAIDNELATTLFHEELDAEALINRIASLPRGEWLAQLPDTGFMTDTPELVTLKPLPIPLGHSDSDDPVDAGTYRSGDEGGDESGQTFQEADHLQWSRTRFTYCLIPGVNSPADAAQRASRWGSGATNSGEGDAEAAGRANMAGDSVDESPSKSQDETDERSGASQSAQGSDGEAEGSRSGGASNEYGTVLGSGTAPPPKDAASDDDDTSHQSTGEGESGPRSSENGASSGDEESPSSGDSDTS
jgi:hypothetical protein